MSYPTITPRIAHIGNLDLVQVATEKLLSRVEGLPGIGVIYGAPGRGKTFACVALANSEDAYYVQMRSAWSRKTLLEKILVEMGIKTAGTIPALLDQICEQLARSRRPLIIDEADFALKNDGMIELIRDIYEGAQGTIILVGEENMPKKLARWERVHSRVMAWIPALPVSIDDVRILAPIYCPNITLYDDLLQHITALANGSVRRACVNLTLIYEAAAIEGEPIMSMATWGSRQFYTGDAPALRRGGV